MQLFPSIKPGILVPQNPLKPYMIHRLGGWLPKNPADFLQWLHGVVAKVREDKKAGRLAEEHASIKKLRELITSNTQVRMYFSLMFEQVISHSDTAMCYNTLQVVYYYLDPKPRNVSN